MKKNEIYETEITGMTGEGAGVCRVEGMAVFVPMTAVGDRLRVRIVKVLKSYAFGIIEELLTPGAGRCEPDCPVFRQCGGCTYRHVDYETESRYKAQQVEDAFARIGGITEETTEFLPICPGRTRTGYRNKAQYPVTEQDGAMVCGFYARHSHRVIPFTRCPLQPERFGEVVEWLLPRLQAAGVTAYDEEAHTGELRHLYLRQGYHTGELMVCFVVRTSIAEKLRELLPALQAQFPECVSITENLNSARTNVILGEQVRTLAGKSVIRDIMCGNAVELSPLSFYQVNTEQAEALYRTAKAFALYDGEPCRLLLDLYCGAGTIGLSMAQDADRVIGVEVVPEAVENARSNAGRNRITNAEFFCGDAGQIASRLREQGTAPDVIILDPPRKGCDQTTLEAAAGMQPKRIVMISCNPATAARDCKRLAGMGFHPERVQPFDLFGGTGHVECVVLMSREE